MSALAGDAARPWARGDAAAGRCGAGPRVRRIAAAERGLWLALRCATDPGRGVAEHQAAIERMLADPRFCALLCVAGDGAPVGLIELVRELAPEPHGRVLRVHCGPDGEAEAVTRALIEAAGAWCARCGLPVLVAEAGEERLARMLAAAGLREEGRFTRLVRALPARAPLPEEARRQEGDGPGGGAPGAAALAGDSQRRVGVTATGPAGGDGPAPGAGAALAALPGLPGEPARWRPGPGTAAMLLLGALSFAFTDLWSSDLLYGALLPLLDVAFIVYLMGLVVVVKYRRRTAARLAPVAAAEPLSRRAR